MRRLLLARPDLSATWPVVVMLFVGFLGFFASFVAFLTGHASERQTDPFVAASCLLMAALPWELRHRVRPARRIVVILVAFSFAVMLHWWVVTGS
jgi:hypothetical protein